MFGTTNESTLRLVVQWVSSLLLEHTAGCLNMQRKAAGPEFPDCLILVLNVFEF